MSTVAVEGVFYADDPQDGASAHLLSTLGVTIFRGAASAAQAATAASLAVETDGVAIRTNAEQSYAFKTGYFAEGGAAVVDVRDSADAWLRIFLHAGDAVALRAGLNHRVGSHTVVAQPISVPVWPSDADRNSRQSTVVWKPRVAAGAKAGRLVLLTEKPGQSASGLQLRFEAGSEEEALANIPHFTKPGTPHVRSLVVELCESFYGLGWVTGTGGSISIRHGDRIFMAPSGVQKERMQAQDIFVLDTTGKEIYCPSPLAGKPRLKLSQCAPLFHHAFTLRNAGACIHTHDINAVMVTLLAGNATEFRITHQEMIKGIAGHGFNDTCVVPIIENTPHECDLADSLEEAMRRYPQSNAVLVRRHGVYVWGSSWEAAKTQAECYHYLFEAAVRMRDIGLDPGEVPRRVESGIGAATAYGSGHEFTGGKTGAVTVHSQVQHVHSGNCCGESSSASTSASSTSSVAVSAASSDGFHGTSGTSALAVDLAAASASNTIPPLTAYSCVVLDVEGATTSIQFVTDVLFPYAAANLRSWLQAHAGSQEAADDVAALVALSAEDVAAKVAGAAEVALPASLLAGTFGPSASPSQELLEKAISLIDANVAWQMSSNRKSGALKQLQGHIWRTGYTSGALKGHVFPDTPTALRAWVAAGKRVYIYSSGSREAQRLLFKHSEAGDLRPLLCGYFDTRTGPKVEAASYKEIALSLGVDDASQVLFATDSLAEAVAASQAGMRVVLTARPGNNALPADHPFAVAQTLLQITSVGSAV
jgi:methylthioribulose 1-phosphate dehydratase/enolase-phosphatase E1